MIHHQQNAVLLSRLLGLRDHSPFILIKDTISQTGSYLVKELLQRVPKDANVIFVSFETINTPERANRVLDASESKSLEDLRETINKALVTEKKNLILIDSISYIPPDKFSLFLIPLMAPHTTITAVYHTDVPLGEFNTGSGLPSSYPPASTLLNYFATSILSVSHYGGKLSTDGSNTTKLDEPDINEEERFLQQVSGFVFPAGCNRSIFRVDLIYRRKSGRGLEASYVVDSGEGRIDYVLERRNGADEEDVSEDADVLKGLTTFNLTTTSKQREARDKVELPFLQAQEVGHGGARGGAIIYEFEKEDDYDEEDPYEDPF